jgi:hypothetical protein
MTRARSGSAIYGYLQLVREAGKAEYRTSPDSSARAAHVPRCSTWFKLPWPSSFHGPQDGPPLYGLLAGHHADAGAGARPQSERHLATFESDHRIAARTGGPPAQEPEASPAMKHSIKQRHEASLRKQAHEMGLLLRCRTKFLEVGFGIRRGVRL